MKSHIPRTGERQVSDATDPDYNDKRITQLRKDYAECPKEWKACFLNGLSKREQAIALNREKMI